MVIMKTLLMDKAFFKKALAITLPFAFQNLISASLNMIDTVMIGVLGEAEIAAVGLANQVYFLFHLLLFGVNSGAAIFIAQLWGSRDIKGIRRVLGIALISGTSLSLLFMLIGLLIPSPILRLFSGDPEVIRLGSGYLRLVSTSFIFNAISFAYVFTLRSTGKVTLTVIINLIALGINTCFNYLLINGRYGFPRMEVNGAAIATVLSRFLETLFLITVIYGKKLVSAGKINEMVDISFDFVRKYFKTTIPVILNEFLWALGVTMFAVVYARMGTEIIAAINIFATVERISMVIFFGLAQAAAVMIGHRIGAGEEADALCYAKCFCSMGPILGIMIGFGLILAADPILSVYNVPLEVVMTAKKIITVYAMIIPFKIFNLINVVGVLRSGGDTRFSLILDTLGIWLIAVPLAFLSALVWKLPPAQVYLLTALEEIFKLVLGVNRLLTGKWINNLTQARHSTVISEQ